MKQKSEAKIDCTPFSVFLGENKGYEPEVVSEENYFPKHVIVRRAYEFLNDHPTGRSEKYNLLTNNCEHFANFVCSGDWKSKQTEIQSVLKTTTDTSGKKKKILFFYFFFLNFDR